MKYSSAVLIAAFAATNVFGHGVVTEVQGANGVNMPGLSLIDDTPRDCTSPRCGSEADTSIIREREMGTARASALGRTQGGGPVDPTKMLNIFMDGANANSTAVQQARAAFAEMQSLQASVVPRQNGGRRTPAGTVEKSVAASTGMGMQKGLPTTGDDGTVRMTFHQVNQDGAGPLTAMVDATSGGKDPKAFQKATLSTDVPGIGIAGISAAQTMDWPVVMKMPAGMTCQGTVGNVNNVCVARLANAAVTGPFGGSVMFTQSSAAKKRAIEYNLAKRHFARAMPTDAMEDEEE